MIEGSAADALHHIGLSAFGQSVRRFLRTGFNESHGSGEIECVNARDVEDKSLPDANGVRQCDKAIEIVKPLKTIWFSLVHMSAEPHVFRAWLLLAYKCVAHEAKTQADDLRPPPMETQETSPSRERRRKFNVICQRALDRAEGPAYASLAGCAATFCRVVGGFFGER